MPQADAGEKTSGQIRLAVNYFIAKRETNSLGNGPATHYSNLKLSERRFSEVTLNKGSRDEGGGKHLKCNWKQSLQMVCIKWLQIS